LLYDYKSGEVDAVLLSLAISTHNIRELGVTNLKVAGYTKLKDNSKFRSQYMERKWHNG